MEARGRKPKPVSATARAPAVLCLVDARAELAQGLAWDGARQRLFWVDTPAGQLFSVSLTSGVVQSWSLPCPIGTIALCGDGRVMAVLLDGIYRFDPATHDLHFVAPLDAPWSGDGLHGEIGPDGAFWIDGIEGETGSLLRVDRDGTIRRISGVLAGALDRDGAGWRPDCGSVVRVARDGQVLRRVSLPVPEPTQCCFGGSDMRTLFIASRRARRGADRMLGAAGSGGIFMIPVDIPGVPARRF